MSAKPWDDVIPDSDRAGFGERPDGIAACQRPAVVVVDMTRAFVDSAYPTGWSATGWPAAKACAGLLEAARSKRLPVYYTKAFPTVDYVTTPQEEGLWRDVDPELADDVPPGDVIVEDIAPRAGEVVIAKGAKPSAFFATPLMSYLTHARADGVIVTGMTTSGCVRATVVDAFQSNLNVIVPFECVADRSQISHKVSLFDMHMKYADVVSLDETLVFIGGI
jgi:maleamate amidohydrolase